MNFAVAAPRNHISRLTGRVGICLFRLFVLVIIKRKLRLGKPRATPRLIFVVLELQGLHKQMLTFRNQRKCQQNTHPNNPKVATIGCAMLFGVLLDKALHPFPVFILEEWRGLLLAQESCHHSD